MAVFNNILAGASGATGAAGYKIERSLRFNSADSSFLSNTFSSASTTYTFSCWIKLGELNTYEYIFSSGLSGLAFDGSSFYVYVLNTTIQATTAKFRDPAAWYHLVFSVNSGSFTLYVNGVSQKTGNAAALSTATNDSYIGKYNATDYYLNGYLADVHFIDGQALAATDFGEYDDNNVWQPKEFAGSYEGGFTTSQATGALPIYNTTGDFGAVKGSGTRSDSSSSTIELAVAMDGTDGGTTFTDEHATIKGSGSAVALTANGNVQTVTSESKFYGSSASFDGSGDYLSFSNINLGTSDFTYEAWVYGTDTNRTLPTVIFTAGSSSGVLHSFGLADSSAVMDAVFGASTRPSSGNYYFQAPAISINKWNHIAWVRSGTTISIYVNGVGQTLQGGNTGRDENANVEYIGSNAANEDFSGYIQDARVYSSAKHTADFTVTGISNSFHLDFSDNSSNAALGTDSSGNSNTWTVNNLVAEQPTTLPGVSLDGSSYLSLADSNDFDLVSSGTGDFTIEFYVYLPDISARYVLSSGTDATRCYINGSNRLHLNNPTDSFLMESSTAAAAITANKWTHIAFCKSSSTGYIFVDGIQYSFASGPALGGDLDFNDLRIGRTSTSLNGFISNLRILKGTALYTANFTPPTAPLSNVTNTKLLCCQSSSSATAAAVAPGTITANGNAFATEFSDSTSANDSLIDTPTDYEAAVGNNGGNYATLNPLLKPSGATLSDGNLEFTSSSNYQTGLSTIGMSSGKWYFEASISVFGTDAIIGIVSDLHFGPDYFPGSSSSPNSYGYEAAVPYLYPTNTSGYSTYTTGDIIGVAYDADNGKIYFAKNGVWGNSSDPVNGTNPGFTGITGGPHFFAVSAGTNGKWVTNFGQRPFAYTPPTGYKSLCTTNLPDPTIADGSTAFDTDAYTGNGSTQERSEFSFEPDLVWIKARSAAYHHYLVDQVRGFNGSNARVLQPNLTNVETSADGPGDAFASFDDDGFTVKLGTGNWSGTNQNNATYVAWAWDAGTTTDTNNTDGTITPTGVRANVSAGFSIVSYTGDSSQGSTIGHGLNAEPHFVIIRNRDATESWDIYHKEVGYGKVLRFSTSTPATASDVFPSSHSSSVIKVGNSSSQNGNNEAMIAYCFAPVEGYSAFGSYVGTGTSPNFVYLGFRPALIITKNTGGANNWLIQDSTRNTYNLIDDTLYPNTNNSEATSSSNFGVDFLSNGFALRTTGGFATNSNNASEGHTYIYAAFAEHPLKHSRAR